ncbi:site-specific integrase [Kocuria sp. CPCC 205281]
MYLSWAEETNRDLLEAAQDFHHFINRLRTEPGKSGTRNAGQPRTDSTVACTLAAIRSFYAWAVPAGHVGARAIALLWSVDPGSGRRAPPTQHPISRTRNFSDPTHLSFSEVVALIESMNSARDRLLVTCAAVLGLRLGQLLGLRRGDVHLVEDASQDGLLDPSNDAQPVYCRISGPHVHVVRRGDNPNRALSKAHHSYAVPVPFEVLPAFDAYYAERHEKCQSPGNDMLFVNLASSYAGRAMSPRRLQEIMSAASRRAGLGRVHPHLLRHTMATTARELEVELDVLQALLGHTSPASTAQYAHVSNARKAEAADRLALFMRNLQQE